MKSWTLLLSDNGSRRPESQELLAARARELSLRLGQLVHAVPLGHSPSEDIPTLEPFLATELAAGARHFAVIPVFLGPSRALSRGIPKVVDGLRPSFPGLEVEVGDPLHAAAEDPGLLAEILQDNVIDRLEAESLEGARVILVDHGSPSPQVTAVRDQLALRLGGLLGDRVKEVVPASMERRPGEEYAFSDPLLEDLLEDPRFQRGPVVLSLLFLAPGRHAGEGGDIDQILARARERHPELHPIRTRLVGENPRLVDLLEKRSRELLERLPG